MSKIQLILKGIKPTPLNRLYTPVCKFFNGRWVGTILLSKESRVTKKIIQAEVLRQKQGKMLTGHLSFYMDIDVLKEKSPDIDATLKQLFDALEGFCYTNDKQILDLRVRKHLHSGKDEITIQIEQL